MVLAIGAFLVGGCSHSDEPEPVSSAMTGISTPLPPPLLNGPACVLLTNLPGFSAHVELVHDSFGGQDAVISGEILGRGPKLLFAPDRDPPIKKNAPVGGFSYIWDVAENSGFVLSEALQGYAPVTSRVAVTNVTVRTDPLAQRSGGPATQVEAATVELNDGSSRQFQIYAAPELKGFPIRILLVSNTVPLRATFTKIRLEIPPPDLFVAPNEFAKYANPEALVDELFLRHHNLRRKSSQPALPSQPPPQ